MRENTDLKAKLENAKHPHSKGVSTISPQKKVFELEVELTKYKEMLSMKKAESAMYRSDLTHLKEQSPEFNNLQSEIDNLNAENQILMESQEQSQAEIERLNSLLLSNSGDKNELGEARDKKKYEDQIT